jgi:hypothetical protein
MRAKRKLARTMLFHSVNTFHQLRKDIPFAHLILDYSLVAQ